MQNTKKEWAAPNLEVLNVNMTMEGPGWKNIDWATPSDADLYNS